MPSILLLLIALLLLFAGIFWLKKIWTGALAGVLYLVLAKMIGNTGASIHYPLINAIIIWLELGLLLIGAFLFYQLLQQKGQLNDFKDKMTASAAPVTVMLLLCWFMGSFMEGIAGFGIPAMLVAPILLSLGYKPLTATVLPLAANTTAVTFGALGTPLKIGFNITEASPTVFYTVLFNCLPALMMPFLLVWLFSKTEGIHVNWHKYKSTILGAGVAFIIPYIAGSFFSVEYPSLLAGGVGMVLFVSYCFRASQKPSFQLWYKTFWPYLLFVAVLVMASIFLKNIGWQWTENTKPIAAFQPGLLFLISGIFFLVLSGHKTNSVSFFTTFKETLQRLQLSLFTILLLVLFTQLIRSEMALFSQQYFPQASLPALLLAPVAGIFGSFITGSATMSNLLLGDATAGSLAAVWVPAALALLNTGSAIGNAISLQNILMVKSVTASNISEKEVMRWNAPVVAVYLLLVVIGVMVYFLISK